MKVVALAVAQELIQPADLVAVVQDDATGYWHARLARPEDRSAVLADEKRSYGVFDNVSGQTVRTFDDHDDAVHMCRGMNMQIGPGGRYKVVAL